MNVVEVAGGRARINGLVLVGEEEMVKVKIGVRRGEGERR